MKHVAMADLSKLQKYWLITGSIAPRPIALVTTISDDGRCNAAPYSSFTYMGEEPPLMVLGIDRYGDESHRGGERKDTYNNILARGEFVVNMVDRPILDRTVLCASDFPAGISEPEAVGLSLEPAEIVHGQRIVESPISWECRLFKVLEYSKIRSLVLGEIVGMSFREELFDAEKMRVRVDEYFPCARLGGPLYCTTTDHMRIPVPTFHESKGVPLV